jgi:ATP-dependent Lon protease
VLFITTANWLDPIHPALRDRLEVIELPGYTEMEKLEIARRHLLPRQLGEHGLNPKLVKLPNATLRHLISDYTREAGVRQLEREIAAVLRKAARRIVSQTDRNGTLTLTPALAAEFLGPSRIQSEKAEPITEVGIATGLAWTPVGGEVLLIEATRMPGAGRLLLTGSLGDVMKESAQTALSYLRSQARKLGLDLTGFDRQDIHIHVPAGAVPKDGPSAGITLAVALASLLLQKPVRSDVAMTGEISLRGRVLRIGGLKEKLLVAARYGIKQVIIPEQNRNDLTDLPEEVRKKLKVHFVRHISEVLPLALREK